MQVKDRKSKQIKEFEQINLQSSSSEESDEDEHTKG